MGMLDFLKNDPDDDYDFEDDFDEEGLDDEDEVLDDDDEADDDRPSGRSASLSSADDDDDEDSVDIRLTSSGSGFGRDFKNALRRQVLTANENLRRRTAEALELIRQTADQPLPASPEAGDPADEEDLI